MEVTEQQRHRLFVWFEEQMGQERAATMMELIPPTGSSELATRRDLEELAARFDGMASKTDLAELRSDLLRTLGTWLFVSQAAVIAAIGVFTGLR